MNKKILSGLAALAVVFSGASALPAGTFEGFSLTASAAKIVDSGTCGENLTWVLDSTGTLVISGEGWMDDYITWEDPENVPPWEDLKDSIRNVILEEGVHSIGICAFSSCGKMESIELPDSLQIIKCLAFCSDYGLTSVTLPDGIYLEDDAFLDCQNLTEVNLKGWVSGIDGNPFRETQWLRDQIEINPVVSLDNIVFDGHSASDYVYIPDETREITSGAFEENENITSVRLPEGLQGLGYNVFHNCTNLTDLNFPAFMSEYALDENEFDGCPSLTITCYKGTGGERYVKNRGINYKLLKKSVIDCGKCGDRLTWSLDSDGTMTVSGTGEMYDYAEWEDPANVEPWKNYKSGIKKLILKEDVESIGMSAFDNCQRLETAEFPDSLKRIGNDAFIGDCGLTSITLPEDIWVDYEAFCDCANLGEIVFKGSINRISGRAFEFTTWLQCRREEDPFVIIDDILVDGQTLDGDIVIPDGVRRIMQDAFHYAEITSVELPDSVREIHDWAFGNCMSLNSVTIPASVHYIEDCAFGYYYDEEADENLQIDGFTIKGYKGTAAEKYAKENEFKFIALDETANKYPVVTSEVQGRQFRLKWTSVPNAQKYGLAVYQSGGWRVKAQFAGNVTSYTSPKIKKGTYKMVVCAKVNGEWDTSSINKRAFTVTITE